jgi:hypothetical protein
MYKIYCLSDPRNNEIKYIGKTSSSLNDRRCSHLWESINSGRNNKKIAWLKSILKLGQKPVISLIEEFDSEIDCNEAEIFWISYFKFIGADLKNHQPGGEGQPKGYQFKKRYVAPKGVLPNQFAEYHKNGGTTGRKKSLEEIEKHRKTIIGRKYPEKCKTVVIENIITKEIVKYLGHEEVIKNFNITKTILNHYIAGSYKFLYKNKYNIYNEGHRLELIRKRKIIAENDTICLIFDSILEISRHFNVNRDIIYSKLNKNKKLGDYKIWQID